MMTVEVNGDVLHIPEEWDAFLYRGYSYTKGSDGVFVQGRFYRSLVGIEQPARTKRPTDQGRGVPPSGGEVVPPGA